MVAATSPRAVRASVTRPPTVPAAGAFWARTSGGPTSSAIARRQQGASNPGRGPVMGPPRMATRGIQLCTHHREGLSIPAARSSASSEPYSREITMRSLRCALVLLLSAPAPAPPLAAQQPDSAPGFDLTEAMIPMRDGVKLHTTIFVPRGSHPPLPFIFTRTPYGIAHAASTLRGYYRALADDGYIFVFQDTRGRYTSEGRFVMRRPPGGREPNAIDESTDAYDTISWLLDHVPNNNGRVGMLGISYPGWLTVMALLDPHPG